VIFINPVYKQSCSSMSGVIGWGVFGWELLACYHSDRYFPSL